MLRFFQNSFLFQVPIYCHNYDVSDGGSLMTSAIYGVLNGLAYYSCQMFRGRTKIDKNPKYSMAFNFYRSKLDECEKYL